MERRLFGTDGIRGVAGEEPMTAETAVRLGRAIAFYFRGSGEARPRILIGKDTRLSGYIFENALSAGICSMGGDVLLVGPMPTPGIAFLTQDMRASAGLVISASHNPFSDNGIKIFGPEGHKLPDEVEARLEALVADESGAVAGSRPGARRLGKAHRIDDAAGRYVLSCKRTFPRNLTLDGMRLALDCANGAGYSVSPAVFGELGAALVTVGVSPDGTNINEGCGSLEPGPLAQLVRREKADLGVALDGDGDRAIFVDERGEVVDGDQIMAICAQQMMSESDLSKKTLVATVMSNVALERFMESLGGHLVRTPVGDRYVVAAMREGGYNLGGEQSGHLIFLDHATTGDGTVCALQVLAVIKRTGKPLSELARILPLAPQVRRDLPVARRVPLDGRVGVQEALEKAERELGREGRLLVRYSGTEPLLRLMAEGSDPKELGRILDRLEQTLAAELG